MVENENVVNPTNTSEANGGNQTPSIDEIKKQIQAEYDNKFKAEVDKASRAIRLDFEKKLNESKMTAEEKAKKDHEEEYNRLMEENKTYKSQISKSIREKALIENGLPLDIFGEHAKLLNAPDEEVPNIVKELKTVWDNKTAQIKQSNVQGTEPAKGSGQAQGNGTLDPKTYEKYPYLKGKV